MKMLLNNQHNTRTIEVETEGWSWGAFFLGFIWYWINGIWGKGLLYLVLCLVLAPTIIGTVLVWLVMASKFNHEYYNFLLDSGYKVHNPNIIEPEAKATAVSYTNELEKLVTLKDRGVISAEEFEVGKKKILS
jgi:hypothetical protein